MTEARYVLLRLAAMTLFLGSPALAQQTRTPLPPSRPALNAPNVAPLSSAPTVNQPKPTDDLDLDPNNLPVLPAASRAQMRLCGREWQEMKRRGADRDQTWKQFATACLQRK